MRAFSVVSPTIAAMSYRFSQGLPFNYPDNDLSYPANFLNMMFSVPTEDFEVDPVIARALDVLLQLRAGAGPQQNRDDRQ